MPTIQNGIVYVASQDENLYAVQLANGKQKWKYKGGPFKASPSLHEGRITLATAMGSFTALMLPMASNNGPTRPTVD